mgnify:FL=1|jgi:prepilin-type N-terminal cleavage/methylation domain-containing protein
MLGPMNHQAARQCHARLHAGRGVTIVELMVTLAILAVLLAVALPSMRDFIARKRMEGVAQELLTDLRLLKSQQQLQNRRAVAISFGSTTDQTCYVLYFVGVNMPHCNCAAAADAVCGAANIMGRPEQIRLVSVPRSTGVTITANQRFIKLLGFDGLPENDTTLLALVESSQAGSIRVATNELGRPSMCSVSGAFGSLVQCPP